MVRRREGSAVKKICFECQEFYTSYCIVKTSVITLPIVYLLNCKKPADAPLSHYRNAHLSTRGLDRRVVKWVSIISDLFALNFCIHVIYTYASIFLRLQPNGSCVSCPVKGEFWDDGPGDSDRSSHDRYRPSENLDTKAIGTRTQSTKRQKLAEYHIVWAHIIYI